MINVHLHIVKRHDEILVFLSGPLQHILAGDSYCL